MQDYLKAVDSLTISDNKSNLLQKQVEELTEQNKEENYIIKGQLAELAELKARQEEAAKQQQMDIEQMKAQLTNTNDQVGMLLQMLSKVNKQEANTTRPAKDFLLRRLGVLTNGEVGGDPDETGVVVEPLD